MPPRLPTQSIGPDNDPLMVGYWDGLWQDCHGISLDEIVLVKSHPAFPLAHACDSLSNLR